MQDWEREQFWGVISGAPRSRSTGQPTPPVPSPASSQAHQFIRDVLEQDLPPAMERAAGTLEARYSPWPTVVVVALVMTAVATTVLAINSLSD